MPGHKIAFGSVGFVSERSIISVAFLDYDIHIRDKIRREKRSHIHIETNSERVEYLCSIGTYFLHKVGVKSTKMVKTSNRPRSMAAEHTQV